MAKINKVIKQVEIEVPFLTIKEDTGDHTTFITKVQPLTQEFGNGDLNTLRDKINEIIQSK